MKQQVCLFLSKTSIITKKEDNTIFQGRCWMDALELIMKCSKLLQKPYLINNENTDFSDNELDSNRSVIKEGSINHSNINIEFILFSTNRK